MSKQSKMSYPQRRALISARDAGDATAHLHGRSAWGGWPSTEAVLRRNGWIDEECRITAAGFRALEVEEAAVLRNVG